ncbi:MAG TPA: beta-ketoacyl-[acyl-carrier-protein] synthase family protein [Terriglobales bacterium]|nr:beta-ketoacyl-[acyl-carrier-protein] synthase family protein [Terriglobales bacterium]
MPRVVITGLGMISALGRNVAENWSSLSAGKPGIGPISSLETADLKFKNGAEICGFSPDEHSLKADYLDRFAQLAAVAAREAVTQSGLSFESGLGDRAAVITGSCVGGQTTQDAGFVDLYRKGNSRMHPMCIPRTMANAGASFISTEHGIRGPVFTVSTACSSSNHAMGQAFWLVRSGAVEAAVTGGSEAPFSYGLLKAWEAMRVVSPDTCRPFSKDRRGLVLGEGAAMLVLESLEHAQARGAEVLGEIVGFGMSSDAGHITKPSPEGAAMAMKAALRDGQVSPEQVGYINAHGTGTPLNDSTETQAIKLALGEHARNVAVSSTKSMHGHALGAAGALEAVATVLALKCGTLPPTANFTEPDPECDLDVIPNHAREQKVNCALSNSFAFGGLNAVLLFHRYTG